MQRDFPTPTDPASMLPDKTEAYEYSWYQVMKKLALERREGMEEELHREALGA